MTLATANKKLIETMDKLSILIPELEQLEGEYQSRFGKLLLSSQQRTEAAREAESKEQLRMSEDKIAERYFTKKVDVRVLLTRKEIIIEISRNLRSLYHGE